MPKIYLVDKTLVDWGIFVKHSKKDQLYVLLECFSISKLFVFIFLLILCKGTCSMFFRR